MRQPSEAEVDDIDDEPDEVLNDFVKPEPMLRQPPISDTVVTYKPAETPEVLSEIDATLLEPDDPGTSKYVEGKEGPWLTISEAYEVALKHGYDKSLSGFRMMATPRNPEKTPPEKLYAEWGLGIDLSRRGGSGQKARWLRNLQKPE